eukprot:TRINITY_DN106040_c0_g1_i1.p1 TRINITY_DN106040_c0_g1~~TRINITY_DN106040_c0_g1_i1.p1  ORF type:complete len:1261 (+),score=170.66 TRINITY_DN106040_c0_g1_i1:87-3869(+)
MSIRQLLPALIAVWASGADQSQNCSKPLTLIQNLAGLSRTRLIDDSEQSVPARCHGDAQCIVPKGATWLLDTSLDVDELIVEGKLVWDVSKAGLELRACQIMVEDGATFQVGSESDPMNKKATIYIKKCVGRDFGTSGAGERFLAGRGTARIEIHGRPLTRTFTLLAQTARAGDTRLSLKHSAQDMGWQVGDKIGVVTTGNVEGNLAGYDPPPKDGSTRHTIESIDGDTITVQPSLTAVHLGGFTNVAGSLYEMAAEVVNMERSVLITGDHDDFFETGQGFHTMIMPSASEAPSYGVMDVRYARLEYCGQLDKKGRYCLHFHLMEHCPKCILKGNALVDTFQPGITIHGTHDSLVDSNICWDNRGAGIYTEDGNEMDNMISNNVIVCSSWDDDRRTPMCRIDWQGGDFRHGGIYAVGKANSFVGNHIAGWSFSIFTPSGGHQTFGAGEALMKVCTKHTPIREVRGNVAHNNGGSGIYLDNQYPRDLKMDSHGYVSNAYDECTDPGNEFTREGQDRGLKMIVKDEFEFFNHAGAVHYTLGDIGFENLVTVRCGNSVYWKRGKNFADAQLSSTHLADSTFVDGWLLLPGGPFTFWIRRVKMAGFTHIQGPQHGFAPTMSVQYVLEDMDWSESTAGTRLRFGSSGGNPVTMLYLTKDNSIGGYHALVSHHLNGFGKVPGCQKAGQLWDNAYGCDSTVRVRRLNIWGPDMGVIKLSGPGYDVDARDPDIWNKEWYAGSNAGRLHYDGPDAGEKFTRGGYATPVIAGESYTLELSWSGDVVFEFSDQLAEEYFGASEIVYFTLITPQGRAQCEVRAAADRNFIAKYAPEGLLPEKAWELGDCGEQLRIVTGQPTRETPTLAPTRAPLGSLKWVLHPGLNCYNGQGAESAGGDHIGDLDVNRCKTSCEEDSQCTGIVVGRGTGDVACYLRQKIVTAECAQNSPWDLWLLEASDEPSPTTSILGGTTLPPSTTSTSKNLATTSSTTTFVLPTTTMSRVPATPATMTWERYEGLNCYGGVGGIAAGGDMIGSSLPLSGCQAACVDESECEGILVVRGEDPGRCWLRKNVEPSKCHTNSAWDLWLLTRSTKPASVDAFEPVSERDAACRGADTADNDDSYYSLTSAPSMDACKVACRAKGRGCKGIEYSFQSKRCEVWTKPEGIGTSIPLSGFACLRYDIGKDGEHKPPLDFLPMNGACRGASPTDNSPAYYTVSSQSSLDSCMDLCAVSPDCTGVEYGAGGRCEVWSEPIQATQDISGYMCHKVVIAR